MASRVTQTVRAIVSDRQTATLGGAARVTQTARVIAAERATFGQGGAARVTQTARVIIATIDLPGGGLMLRGVGS